MITAEFDYFAPTTVKEASQLLTERKNSMILAGGTDILIRVRNGAHRPARLVDIKNIKQLKRIEWVKEGLFIGSCVTWTQIKENPIVKDNFPALHQASQRFGCREIRNRATIGGNICNASPGAEAGGPAVVYEALIKVESLNGKKLVPVNKFITGPGRTSLQTGEITTGVILPKPPQNSRSAYRRTARVKGQDLATCAITIMAVNPETPESREIRAGLSAVMKTPFRPPELEKILSQKPITREVLKQAKQWMRDNLHPRASSLRGTPDYKREVIGGMLEILLGELQVLDF